jgi:hypothetical protein
MFSRGGGGSECFLGSSAVVTAGGSGVVVADDTACASLGFASTASAMLNLGRASRVLAKLESRAGAAVGVRGSVVLRSVEEGTRGVAANERRRRGTMTAGGCGVGRGEGE